MGIYASVLLASLQLSKATDNHMRDYEVGKKYVSLNS